MKKRFLTLALCLVFICIFCVSAYAASDRVVDGAALLYDYEIAVLENKLAEISDDYDVDVVIVTVDSLNGKSAASYADDQYDLSGYRSDGVLLLVAMQEREWFISTAGSCIVDINDDGISYIEDEFLWYLSDGDYYEAFRTFAGCCDELLRLAASGQPYEFEDSFPFSTYATVSLIVGLISAWLATAVMKGKLKSIRPQDTADNYVRQDSMKLTQQADLYLYSRVTRVAKPKDNSTKSGTRISSSGVSHGGRGGRF